MDHREAAADSRIPYVNIAAQHAPIRDELLAAVGRVLDRGNFVLGAEVESFEHEFARACGVAHAIGVNSGTDALWMALRALGIGPGDEVITAPNSFIASVTAIKLVGASPVLVDVGDDYNILPDAIEAAITPRTRGILPVHLTGRPCDMGRIMEIAERHGVHVIEDCAQAAFARFDGKSVGAFGTIGCFSLHPLKTLNACGDGGMLTTDDRGIAEQLRLMRNIGLRTRDDCVMWSPNSRLDTVQAAMLLVKLKYAPAWTQARRDHAEYYRSKLAGVPGLRVPVDRAPEYAVYHTFVVQSEKRDGLRAFLAERGIGSNIHYPVPIHLSTVGRELGYAEGSFPVAERQARHIVSLPVYPELSRAQLDRVCDAVTEFSISHSRAIVA